MKFDCGPTAEEKQDAALAKWRAQHEWHRWFAWFPVRIGSHDCRWLETVERRLVGITRTEYRARAAD